MNPNKRFWQLLSEYIEDPKGAPDDRTEVKNRGNINRLLHISYDDLWQLCHVNNTKPISLTTYDIKQIGIILGLTEQQTKELDHAKLLHNQEVKFKLDSSISSAKKEYLLELYSSFDLLNEKDLEGLTRYLNATVSIAKDKTTRKPNTTLIKDCSNIKAIEIDKDSLVEYKPKSDKRKKFLADTVNSINHFTQDLVTSGKIIYQSSKLGHGTLIVKDKIIDIPYNGMPETAASILAVKKTELYRMLRTGVIKAKKTNGNWWFIELDALVKYIYENR